MVSVYKRKESPFYQAKITVGGRTRRISTQERVKSRALAYAQRVEAEENQRLEREAIEANSISFVAAAALYFEESSVRPRTLDGYRNSFKNIYGTLGGGFHVGIGAARPFGRRSEIGVRLELDNLGSDLLLAVRALDYRRHLNDRIAVGGFVGAARLDLATPAYGYYLGGGVYFKEVVSSWDLGIDLRFGDKVARDNVLPTDPQGGSPDNFYDITSLSLYLRHKF